MKEFDVFFKTVEGAEGNRCNYPTRLDTYGCGCQHDCKYCYAKSLLAFRGYWNPSRPHVSSLESIRNTINKLPANTAPIRLGGMTDCFQPLERVVGVTLKTIKELNAKHIPYLIVTKSDLVAQEPYISVMDKSLAHIQISLTCTNDAKYRELDYEKAPLPSKRIQAIEKLQEHGFDISVRLSPFIPEFIDFDVLNSIKCDKILVEFLRVNAWVRKWFKIDYSKYTVLQNGYRHMHLLHKMEYMKMITGFKQVSVCEDENRAYKYWKYHFNPNPNDCCNLRG